MPGFLRDAVHIQAFIEREQRDALFQLAQDQQLSLSAMIRRAISDFLESYQKSDQPEEELGVEWRD